MNGFILYGPLLVGGIVFLTMTVALVIGRIKFVKGTWHIAFNPQKKLFEITAGPFFGIFLLSFVLTALPLVISYFKPIAYNVSGDITVQDASAVEDVSIFPCFPPGKPDGNGKFGNIRVWRDPDGNLPWLAIELPGYPIRSVDLNDQIISDGEIILAPLIIQSYK